MVCRPNNASHICPFTLLYIENYISRYTVLVVKCSRNINVKTEAIVRDVCDTGDIGKHPREYLPFSDTGT